MRSVYDYFEIGAFIISLITYPHSRKTALKWAPFFLACTVFFDIIAPELKWKLENKNHWLYNIYLSILYLFFTNLYYNALPAKKWRRWILLVSVIVLVAYLVNLFYFGGFYEFNSQSFSIISIAIILYSGFYLRKLMLQDSSQSIFSNYMFWITISCFTFFTGMSVFLGTYNYMVESSLSMKTKVNLTVYTTNIVNVLFYSFFSVGLWTTIKTKHG